MPAVLESDLDPATEALAQEMVAAFEAGDVDAWGRVFAADGVCWHSHSGVEISPSANVELLRGLFGVVVDEGHYLDVRRHAIEGGYVQQHVLSMRARNGSTYTTGVCTVVHVFDGRVARLDEYLDSSVIQWGIDNAPVAAGSGSSPEGRATAAVTV